MALVAAVLVAVADHRPRSRAEGPRRDSRDRSTSIGRCTSASSASLLHRRVQGRRPGHRRAEPTDRPFLKAKTHLREPAVVDDLHSRADRRERRHDRLGDARRAVPTAATTSPSSCTNRRIRTGRPMAVHHDGSSVIARAASSSTRITRRPWLVVAATSKSASSRDSTPTAARAVPGGSVKIQSLRGVSRGHADALQDRRRQDQLERHRSAERRRFDRSVTGYVDIATLARDALQREVADRLSDAEADFFKDMNFTVSGHGDFTGTFRFFKATAPRAEGHVQQSRGRGERVAVSRTSRLAAVDPTSSEVTDVNTGLYGGRAKFDYTWSRSVSRGTGPGGVGYDLHRRRSLPAQRLSPDAGVRLAGRASGRNRLEWPLGQVRQETWRRTDHGDRASRVSCRSAVSLEPTSSRGWIRFLRSRDRSTRTSGSATCPWPARSHTPSIRTGSRSKNGWAATDRTYVEFTGRTAWGQRSQMPFHVTSIDWQESDRCWRAS